MKKYFAYIRVSTVKQGEKSSSLDEQRAAILAYAQRHNLTITQWFEEQETAAKQGRPVFTIAVGMPITEHPPHRSVRATFPHTAPTVGV